MKRFFLFFIFYFLITGCYSATANLVVETHGLKYPVSMTPLIHDPMTGKIIDSTDYEVKGKWMSGLSIGVRGSQPIKIKLAKMINPAIARYGGDGMVNFKVNSFVRTDQLSYRYLEYGILATVFGTTGIVVGMMSRNMVLVGVGGAVDLLGLLGLIRGFGPKMKLYVSFEGDVIKMR